MDASPALRALRWLDERRDEMLALLEPLVLAESPSTDPGSQELVLALVGHPLRQLGFRLLRLPGKATGGALLARQGRSGPAQLVLGHTDTVWPHGTLARQPFRVDGDRVYGPGTYDMKAGLVQLVFALRAIAAIGRVPALQPVILLNSDEEIGSPESTRHVARLARVVRRALVLEPSYGPCGHLKTARKGVGKYVVHVDGRAAHAGLEPEKGVSAIRGIADVVRDVYALEDPARGLTLNVGQLEGGTRPNVVAAHACAVVDVRAPTRADADHVDRAIRGLHPTLPGAAIRVEGGFLRPPMERRPDLDPLVAAARRYADELGFPLEERTAGGGSDGNTTARFVPTLDGLGALGDGAHAAHEHVSLASLPRRAALLAAVLLAD